jgi:hypothetical protein
MHRHAFPNRRSILAGLLLYPCWILIPLLVPGWIAANPGIRLNADLRPLLWATSITGICCGLCFLAAALTRRQVLAVIPPLLAAPVLGWFVMQLPDHRRLPQDADPAAVQRLESMHAPQSADLRTE